MTVDLSGRAVLVTGGTKGLGRGLVAAFQAVGASVLTCARTVPESLPPGVEFVAADLRDAGQAGVVVDAAVQRLGRLDVVVNNAGGSPEAAAATVSPRFIEKVVALNLLAPFYLAQRANAVMQEQSSGGVIVNIGSLSGHRASPGTAAYGAAKAGLANLTRSLAMEWAPKVRVNAITVGYLDTGDHTGDDAGSDTGHYGGSAGQDRIARALPMGRLVRPADVAAVCLFLASAEAEFVTGADVAVDAGGEPPPFLSARA